MMRWAILLIYVLSTGVLLGQKPRLVLPIGHTKALSTLAISSNQKQLLSGSEDGTMRLWDVNSGKELISYSGHFGAIQQATFFHSDERILSIAEQNTAKIWDTKKGTVLFELIGHEDNIKKFVISPDEKIIITTSEDGAINAWDAATGHLINSKNYFNWGPETLDLDSTGTKVFTYDDDRFILLDLETDSLLMDLSISVQALESIPGTNAIILGFYMTKTFLVYDITKNKTLKFEGTIDDITHIQASKNGNVFFTSTYKGDIECWDAHTFEPLYTLHEIDKEEEQLLLLEFSSDDELFFTTTTEGITNARAIATGKLIYSFKETSTVSCFLFPEHSNYFFTGMNDNSIVMRNLKDGKEIQRITGKSNSVFKLIDITDSPLLLSVSASAEKNSIMHNAGTFKITATNKLSGKIVYEISEGIQDINNIISSSDFFAVKTNSGKIRTYDLLTGQFYVEYTIDTIGFVDFKFDKSQSNLLKIVYENGRLISLNCENGSQSINQLKTHGISQIKPIAQTDKWWVVDKKNTVFLMDLASGNQELILKGSKKVDIAFIEGTDSMFLTIGVEKMKLYNFKTSAKRITPLQYRKTTNEPYEFFDSEGKLVDKRTFIFNDAQLNDALGIIKIRMDHSSVQFFTIMDGKLLEELQIENFQDDSFAYCNFIESKICRFNTTNQNEQLIQSNAYSNEQLFALNYTHIKDSLNDKKLKGHTYPVTDVINLQNEAFFMSSAWDGTSILWKKDSGEKLSTRMILDGGNWISFLPTGYYFCSKEASKYLHYVDSNLNIITFDQLDIKYNRPDLILEAGINSDPSFVNSYHKAYLKRIKKLGIDTTTFIDGFSFPELSIVNKEALQAKQSKEFIELHIKGFENNSFLDRLNVWINEVPVFGERGYSLQTEKAKWIDTVIVIQLGEGENRIEASVTNSNAIESLHSPIYVQYSPVQPSESKTIFIGIGMDKFQDSTRNLNYSVKDIRDLSSALKLKLKDNLVIDTLFNEKVTVAAIQALKTRLLKTTINDKVIIVYSGHGLLSQDYDYFLSSYNINFQQPEINGIPYEVLTDLLDRIPARKKLLLIDACHSGEIDKDELIASNEASIEGEKDGNNKVKIKLGKVGLTNSFLLMQDLFVNVQKGSGATIISAAGGDQSALEGGGIQNGYFTYSILQYLQSNESISINDLRAYVFKEVPILSKGKQKPTSRLENLTIDWKLW